MQRDKDYVDQHVKKKKKKIKKWKPQRVSHQKCTAVGDSLMITSPRRRNLKGFIIRLQHPTIHAGKRKYTVKVLHISPQTTPDPSPCHPLLTGRFASWHVPSLLHDLLSHRLTYLLANVALKRAENTKRKNKKKNQALGGQQSYMTHKGLVNLMKEQNPGWASTTQLQTISAIAHSSFNLPAL